jgi:preprotein translocase subunit SecE
MNREMRRLQEREERLQKKQDPEKGKSSRRPGSAPAKPQAEKKSFFKRIGGYLHEVRVELRKVTWPTREQMIAFTSVTVLTCVILTGVVFALDVAMKELVFWLVEKAG